MNPLNHVSHPTHMMYVHDKHTQNTHIASAGRIHSLAFSFLFPFLLFSFFVSFVISLSVRYTYIHIAFFFYYLFSPCYFLRIIGHSSHIADCKYLLCMPLL
ncbi:hypothetical protein ASPBRDRAFT_267348 [Aspergillus brasiliensis CBS 101740]|uniref:Uncharacterized protein n=1 Tax=Aspergillus brasiliensis (strain CBS 101740 / IMI 381727 / IBT 21946) TaxID=767769 RepID=A0A1L9V357_ASPBC|nr:hypothetical protein ASPBRDRAFT_267348 [Aspergillus brasiliensis CBS 101740]